MNVRSRIQLAIKNIHNRPLNLSFSCDAHENFTYSNLDSAVLAPSSTFEMVVTFLPKALVCHWIIIIYLIIQRAQKTKLYINTGLDIVVVNIAAEIPVQALVIPDSLNFEKFIVESTTEKTFKMSNNSDSAINFVFSDEAPFTVFPKEGRIEPKSSTQMLASCTLKVRAFELRLNLYCRKPAKSEVSSFASIQVKACRALFIM